MAASRITKRFAERFPSALTKARLVGREAEYPVVWKDGNAADARLLIKALDNAYEGFETIDEELPSFFQGTQSHRTGLRSQDKKLEVYLEVGWGTLEVITGPYGELWELKNAHDTAMERIVKTADSLGMKILGTGMQPRTPPSLNLMTPRPRYLTMREAVGPEVWDIWAITASDQIHIDVTLDEVPSVTNLVNILHPVVIALCGNSSIYSGEISEFNCARQALMEPLGTRHGMPAVPIATMEDHIQSVMDNQLYWLRDEKGNLNVYGDRTFSSFCNDTYGTDPTQACSEKEYEDFLLHDHYCFHSARPRSKQRTVECRAACQQPWNEHMAAATLHLGMSMQS
ncbi:hypothetical protein AAMO2058_000488200 [Amorphochlora amoebiformis]